MPRLMMSRPWAMRSVARASTAKAFSSPMRSNAAMVLSMGVPPGRAFWPLGWVLGDRDVAGIAAKNQIREREFSPDVASRGSAMEVALDLAILMVLFLLNG